MAFLENLPFCTVYMQQIRRVSPGFIFQICQVKCSFGYTAQYIQVDCLGS